MDKNDPRPLMERAVFLVSEISSALEFLFDDGVTDEKDAQLANLAKVHKDDAETPDAMASQLMDYAGMAQQHRAELDGLGGFKAARIDEANEVAVKLRALPAVAGKPSAATGAALGLRNRLMTLLAQRVGMVRSAARFVYRNHPHIARQAASAYERRRRAAARRGAKKSGSPG